jgi:hypothetical protein
MFLATFHSDFRGETFSLYQLFTQLFPKKNNLSQIACLSLKKSPPKPKLKNKIAYNKWKGASDSLGTLHPQGRWVRKHTFTSHGQGRNQPIKRTQVHG